MAKRTSNSQLASMRTVPGIAPAQSLTSEEAHLVQWRRREVILLFLALTAVYLLIVAIQMAIHPPTGTGFHFIYLADGWLHGHLYISTVPSGLADYTFYKGHWYVAFPPLPAILLLPFVAILHLSYQALLSLIFSVSMGILNIGLMLWVLKRFAQSRIGGEQFATAAWLLLLFALGTETLYVTMEGSVWFLAHVVATTFVLLFIGETLGKRRPWLAAIFLGLASLSRSTTLLTFPFFLVWIFALERKQLFQERKRLLVVLRQYTIFGAVLGVFVVGMLLYNQARFGSLFNFGYNTMNVNPVVGNDLHAYGQFNKHFIRTNVRFMFLEPPKLIKTFPYLTFNPFGTGIFWTMPALLGVFLAFRQRAQRWLAASLLSACALPTVAFLLYFNTGWYQFGYRFALDFLPFALLLAALGMSTPLTWRAKTLIVLSVLLNLWGYFVFNYFRPPLLG